MQDPTIKKFLESLDTLYNTMNAFNYRFHCTKQELEQIKMAFSQGKYQFKTCVFRVWEDRWRYSLVEKDIKIRLIVKHHKAPGLRFTLDLCQRDRMVLTNLAFIISSKINHEGYFSESVVPFPNWTFFGLINKVRSFGKAHSLLILQLETSSAWIKHKALLRKLKTLFPDEPFIIQLVKQFLEIKIIERHKEGDPYYSLFSGAGTGLPPEGVLAQTLFNFFVGNLDRKQHRIFPRRQGVHYARALGLAIFVSTKGKLRDHFDPERLKTVLKEVGLVEAQFTFLEERGTIKKLWNGCSIGLDEEGQIIGWDENIN